MLLDEHIQSFLIYLQTQRRYSERTIVTYRKSLEKYLLTLQGNEKKGGTTDGTPQKATTLEAFSETSIKGFVWDLKIKQKLAPTSICEHLAALKSFGKYLVRSKIIDRNPAETVPMPKRPKRLVNVLGQKDLAEDKLNELEQACKPTLPQVRARLLLELIYGSGLRISECQNLTWDHIDTGAILVRVLGKGIDLSRTESVCHIEGTDLTVVLFHNREAAVVGSDPQSAPAVRAETCNTADPRR